MNQTELLQLVSELQTRVTTLESKITELSKPRDRGPKSQGEMTDADAFSVKFGEHAKTAHKAAAEALGLSYGQVFSCRGGYTFKHIKEDWKAPVKA